MTGEKTRSAGDVEVLREVHQKVEKRFLHGKTSNLELDPIFKNYFLHGNTFPCATLPLLTGLKEKHRRN